VREGEEGGEGGKEGGGKEGKKKEMKGRRGKEEREKEEAEGEEGGWVVLSGRDLTPCRLNTYAILSMSTPSTSIAFR
jgi:hypothetical protein